MLIPQTANGADLRSYIIVFINGFVDFPGLLLGGARLFDKLVILCGQPVDRVGPFSRAYTYAIRDILVSLYPSTFVLSHL